MINYNLEKVQQIGNDQVLMFELNSIVTVASSILHLLVNSRMEDKKTTLFEHYSENFVRDVI